MTRILIIGDAGSIHTKRIARYLVDQGNEVHVASFVADDIAENITVHLMERFKLGKLGYIAGIGSLRRILKRVRPEVCNAHYITSYGFVAALAGARPLVQTAWGSDVLLNIERSSLFRLIIRYLLRKSAALILVAEHMREKIAPLLPSRLEVFTIPYGVDAELFNYLPRPVHEGEPLRIINTRHLDDIYRIDSIIDAVADCRDAGLKIELDIVGTGALRKALETQVKNLGLEDDVRFLGRIDHSALPRVLQQAHIFVSASLSDGNNISLNEAMACGLFPIASDIPANRQWIESEKNGFLFPAGDWQAISRSIQKASADRNFWIQVISTNRKIVEQRADWQVNARKMEQILRSVADVRYD